MRDNLPQKYKRSFFQSIVDKIKSLFGKKKVIEENVSNNIEENIEIRQNFVDKIKVNEKNPEKEKKEFMKNLEENPQLLQEFSNDRLEKILQYYVEENERKRKILESLS